MKLTFTGTYTIDIEKKKTRINRVNTGAIRERQLHLVDLFMAGKLNDWIEAYNKLPYDKKGECTEKEYVSTAFTDIIEELCYSRFELDSLNIDLQEEELLK